MSIDFANVKQLIYEGTEVYESTRKSNGAYLWTKPLGKLTITGSVLVGGSYSITRTNKLSPYSTTGSINSGAMVYYGDTIKLTAVPNEGYKVVGNGVKETTFKIETNEIPTNCYMYQNFEFARDSLTAPIISNIRQSTTANLTSLSFDVRNDNLEDVSMSYYVYDTEGELLVGYDDERTIDSKTTVYNVGTSWVTEEFPWAGTLKVVFEIEGGTTGETSQDYDFRTQLAQASVVLNTNKTLTVSNPNSVMAYADIYYLDGQTWQLITGGLGIPANGKATSLPLDISKTGDVYFTINLISRDPRYKSSQLVTILNFN